MLALIQEQGLVDDLQLEEVVQEHTRSGKPAIQLLQDFGLLDLETILQIMASHLGTEVVELRELELTLEEKKSIGGFLFLSARPVLYVLNLGDEEADKLDMAVVRHKLGQLEGRPKSAVVGICGRLEAELAEMEEKEAAELLASYGLQEPGLNRLIRATYDLLGLIQFFTAGEPEVRAWTIRKGDPAVKGAGVIHSDIEKGFIRAEVVRWNDLVAAGSIAADDRGSSATAGFGPSAGPTSGNL